MNKEVEVNKEGLPKYYWFISSELAGDIQSDSLIVRKNYNCVLSISEIEESENCFLTKNDADLALESIHSALKIK